MNGLQFLGWLALAAYVGRAVYVDWRAERRPLHNRLTLARLPDELGLPLDVSLRHVPHSQSQEDGRHYVGRSTRF